MSHFDLISSLLLYTMKSATAFNFQPTSIGAQSQHCVNQESFYLQHLHKEKHFGSRSSRLVAL